MGNSNIYTVLGSSTKTIHSHLQISQLAEVGRLQLECTKQGAVKFVSCANCAYIAYSDFGKHDRNR